MKMSTKIGVSAVGSVLFLALAVGGFRPFSNARTASAMKISLQDMSGKPLSSLFDGMPTDRKYPELKRLVAEQRSRRCGQPSRASRLLQELGLWFEPVAHACDEPGCSCGYIVYPPYVYCADACGGDYLDGVLRVSNCHRGIMNGSATCTAGPPQQCPPRVPTENCCCYCE